MAGRRQYRAKKDEIQSEFGRPRKIGGGMAQGGDALECRPPGALPESLRRQMHALRANCARQVGIVVDQHRDPLETLSHRHHGACEGSVRDRRTLQKLDEWDTHGIDPHPLALDAAGPLIVANGGAPRTLADQKYDLQHMESSLVRLDTASGSLLEFG
ncbi:MAG: hypothetical protein AW06_001442 [Candidatus Accumulibacter cognatus]|uniref:Uncharacterized protein n=3 Tax=Betaproteobacteria incertae sedis TaxID=119066 RepID=A0A080M814_9PROT|nr:MAG: hypothetical protein AW06_001442 [Candidatus Accumulibacter cognatus]MBL8401854.1 DUF1513 domain-containing protein [Accumulibacter sp.]